MLERGTVFKGRDRRPGEGRVTVVDVESSESESGTICSPGSNSGLEQSEGVAQKKGDQRVA